MFSKVCTLQAQCMYSHHKKCIQWTLLLFRGMQFIVISCCTLVVLLCVVRTWSEVVVQIFWPRSIALVWPRWTGTSLWLRNCFELKLYTVPKTRYSHSLRNVGNLHSNLFLQRLGPLLEMQRLLDRWLRRVYIDHCYHDTSTNVEKKVSKEKSRKPFPPRRRHTYNFSDQLPKMVIWSTHFISYSSAPTPKPPGCFHPLVSYSLQSLPLLKIKPPVGFSGVNTWIYNNVSRHHEHLPERDIICGGPRIYNQTDFIIASYCHYIEFRRSKLKMPINSQSY